MRETLQSAGRRADWGAVDACRPGARQHENSKFQKRTKSLQHPDTGTCQRSVAHCSAL